jgi:hypothetical protein
VVASTSQRRFGLPAAQADGKRFAISLPLGCVSLPPDSVVSTSQLLFRPPASQADGGQLFSRAKKVAKKRA